MSDANGISDMGMDRPKSVGSSLRRQAAWLGFPVNDFDRSSRAGRHLAKPEAGRVQALQPKLDVKLASDPSRII